MCGCFHQQGPRGVTGRICGEWGGEGGKGRALSTQTKLGPLRRCDGAAGRADGSTRRDWPSCGGSGRGWRVWVWDNGITKLQDAGRHQEPRPTFLARPSRGSAPCPVTDGLESALRRLTPGERLHERS